MLKLSSLSISFFPFQGLYFRDLAGVIEKPRPVMFMFDLEKVEDGLVELKMDIDEEQFNPHGVGHWVTPEGHYIVYVISHQELRDTVESFYFIGEEKLLKHRVTFEHSLFRQLNDIVVVGLDEFYVTVDHYFSHPMMKAIESLLWLPLSTVVYCNKAPGLVKAVAGGLAYANGIAQSNNHRSCMIGAF